MAGDNATITAFPNSAFTTPVTVIQPDTTVPACAVAQVMATAAIINFIIRIDFPRNEKQNKHAELPLSGRSPVERCNYKIEVVARSRSSLHRYLFWICGRSPGSAKVMITAILVPTLPFRSTHHYAMPLAAGVTQIYS